MDECQPCAGDRARGSLTDGKDPAALRPATHPGPRTGHSLPRRSRTTGSLLPASRGAGPGGPTGSPPMADGTRFPWFRDAEEIRDMRHFFGRVFNPIAYEFAGACHDETSSSARGSRRPRPPGPAEAIRPGWAHDRATRATGSCRDPEGRDPASRWAGDSRCRPTQCRSAASSRHDDPSSGVVDPGPPGLDRPPGGVPTPGPSSRRPGQCSSPGSRTSGRTDSHVPGPSR